MAGVREEGMAGGRDAAGSRVVLLLLVDGGVSPVAVLLLLLLLEPEVGVVVRGSMLGGFGGCVWIPVLDGGGGAGLCGLVSGMVVMMGRPYKGDRGCGESWRKRGITYSLST